MCTRNPLPFVSVVGGALKRRRNEQFRKIFICWALEAVDDAFNPARKMWWRMGRVGGHKEDYSNGIKFDELFPSCCAKKCMKASCNFPFVLKFMFINVKLFLVSKRDFQSPQARICENKSQSWPWTRKWAEHDVNCGISSAPCEKFII